MFPEISNIDVVLEAIEGRQEFYVRRDEINGYQVVNYHVNLGLATFPALASMTTEEERARAMLLRECRGITFDLNGRLLARKYHKFFNVGEHPDSQVNQIDLSQFHVIMEKLDGSMIVPIILNDRVEWTSKMGLTDVASNAADFAEAGPGRGSYYADFAWDMAQAGLTTIFEWCSRKNRIVIDYPRDRLVLTAIRRSQSGKYLSYDDMCLLGDKYGIEVVRVLPGSVESMERLMADARGLIDAEGYVIRFSGGQMFKLKAEKYCLLHKTKEQVNVEKNVLRLVLDDHLDDLVPNLDAPTGERLRHYQAQVVRRLTEVANQIRYDVQERSGLSQKDFALWVTAHVPPYLQGVYFSTRRDPENDAWKHLTTQIRRATSTQAGVEGYRELLGQALRGEPAMQEEG